MANKTYIEFDGFDEVVNRIKKLDGDIKGVTEKALKETHKIITNNADKAIRPHHKTGQTEKSLKRQAEVKWSGSLASVEVGFDISNGGLASIFLMYGTKGTPRHPPIKKDQKLYNAFFGKKTREEIMKLQENIFYDEIRRFDA